MNENWTVSTGVWTTSTDNCPWFAHKCSTWSIRLPSAVRYEVKGEG
jgi:hypothetical protein